MKNFPDTEQETVRQYILSAATEPRSLYSPEVVKLFQ